ncbi:hypothetical protein KGA65_17480 [Ideonella sp. B7]|uniref:hypothetical protein n=1 Tax=Ideonella benzenivorans TaxID=2831643 RepID=UPI001CEC0CC4|nr:hypothetical protein [Ideonella benzenivorans]MCA6218330.1 hypothetical protein [Ideonella benzenivorans]
MFSTLIDAARTSGRTSAHFGQRPLVLALALAGMLSACGGGGGATSASGGGQSESSQGNTSNPGSGSSTPAVVTTDAVSAQAHAFFFNVDGSQTSASALEAATGGSTLGQWNPVGSSAFYAPGLKVSFFGDPQGCDALTKTGTVVNGSAGDLSYVTGKVGVSLPTSELSWVPSGSTTGCSGVSDRSGPSAVYLNADASAGGLALYTSAGPRGDSKPEFFQQFQSTGQDGNGTNANIVGTYLAFRQTWRSNPTVQPFVGTSQTARVLVNQAVTATTLGASSGALAQVQQLVNLHLINNTCRVEGITAGRPCQMNYLFNTAIARNNVTDWSTVSWAQTVRVWFDAAQGGVPIIEGQLQAKGTASTDSENGLSMYTSQGNATQHGTFSPMSFDVRITMSQLANALRILTGKALGIAPTAVTEAQLAAMWSADWNNPSAWVAESVTAAQEISSADRTRSVDIAGYVRQLYVGPAAN